MTTQIPEMEMQDRVRAEWDALGKAITAVHNAFGYVDDENDHVWSADAWWGAYAAVADVGAYAAELLEAVRAVAVKHDDALDA